MKMTATLRLILLSALMSAVNAWAVPNDEVEEICAGLEGSAHGLCVAAVKSGCGVGGDGNERACERLSDNFTRMVGSVPPWTETNSPPGVGEECGGFEQIPCAEGLTCIDDPAEYCDEDCGGTNCRGICVEEDDIIVKCGGYNGPQCQSGEVCVDAKGDTCSSNCGGADCGGFCVKDWLGL